MSSYKHVGLRCKKGECTECLDTACYHDCHGIEHPNLKRANAWSKK